MPSAPASIESAVGDAELQARREAIEEQQSRERAMALEADQRAKRQESRLAHGRALLQAAARPLVEAMKVDVAMQLSDPTAGTYHAGYSLIP